MKVGNLYEVIQKIAERSVEVLPPVRATVVSINLQNYTITAQAQKSEKSAGAIYEATLRSVVGEESGVIVVPVKGSSVIIEFAHNAAEQAFVTKVAEVDKIIIRPKTTLELQINKDAAARIVLSSDGIAIGEAVEPAVLGDTLETWCKDVDSTLNAIIQWGATGVSPTSGPGPGGIAPLAGVSHQAVGIIKSEKVKLS
jgi:hypothetical protein